MYDLVVSDTIDTFDEQYNLLWMRIELQNAITYYDMERRAVLRSMSKRCSSFHHSSTSGPAKDCKEHDQQQMYGGVIVPSDILRSRSGDTSGNMSDTLHYVHVRN